MSENKYLTKDYAMKLLLAVVGIILVGTGVAFNAAAALGNDSVGIVYDGIRNTLGLTSEQLGMASNVVNISLMIIVFLCDRHYVNVGTFVYILPYGMVVDFGGRLYHTIFTEQILVFQIVAAVIGCLLLYTGVAMYITADIGVDPFTGIVMVIRDKLKKEYRFVKMGFDFCCIILGTVLGGKLGMITVITMLTAGPGIQFFADQMGKLKKSS